MNSRSRPVAHTEAGLRITLLDRSLYFKGLLLLARKDKQITPAELALMSRIGRCLDFEAGFCENTIQDIVGNKIIADSPPVFSAPEIAERFIKDGLTLGSCDHAILPGEYAWLDAIAQANRIELEPIVADWKSAYTDTATPSLEAERLVYY